LIVVSGPAGVGKTTLVAEVLRRTGAQASVSATTRAPRHGEVNGRDYHFVDRPTFERMIRDGELLEWAEVFGNLYGTPEEPVRQALDEGKSIVLAIDVQGGLQVAAKRPGATFVLIVPPSHEELVRRLSGRKTETPEALRHRLNKAEEEIRVARASGAYRYEVVNDKLPDAVRQLADIVQERVNQ
jgi:guanylate kinase